MSNSTGFPLRKTHEATQATLAWRVFEYLGDRFRRFTAVNELQQLSDRQLRDIGVDRRQIEAIADREIARLRAR
jgi:uncharacterized protein YjiS (DUF1127 family)